MKLLQFLRGHPENDYSELSALDRVTKAVAVAASRRRFLKQVLAGGAAIGFGLWEVRPANAACTTCNFCQAACGCEGDVRCCRPDGSACYYKWCSLGSGCVTPPGTQAWIQACNGCTPTHGCATCFW